MVHLIWNYLEKITITVQNTKYHVPIVVISNSKFIEVFAVSICSKLMWKVCPIMLWTQLKPPPLKTVMSLQNWRTLRSRTLGQLPSTCIFYSLSLHDHILCFMEDLKIYSITLILCLYFILNFHCVTYSFTTSHYSYFDLKTNYEFSC